MTDINEDNTAKTGESMLSGASEPPEPTNKIYEYRTQLVGGAANTIVADGELNWIHSFISREEFQSLFGGSLISADGVSTEVRYRGVWGKDKVRKFKRILRERGAIFEVCKIDGTTRSLEGWVTY